MASAWRAVASFAKAHGIAMLDRVAGNGVRVILVESPDRFARDLSVQITGHDYLRALGVELVPTSAPVLALSCGASRAQPLSAVPMGDFAWSVEE